MTPPCILLVVVAAGLLTAVGADNCLNDIDLVRRPYAKKEITLLTSSRPSHRMVTLVFSLYLQEFLKCSDVNIISEPDQFDGPGVVANLSGQFNKKTTKYNASLEAWSYPGSLLVPIAYWRDVSDCGDLVLPGGRFFWKANNHPEGLDYRQLFHQSDIVAELAFDDPFGRQQVLNWTRKHQPCPKNFTKCALLLAEHYSDSSWVVQHIEKLQMAVEVAWLGDRFSTAVRALAAASHRPLLLLTYTGHPLEEDLAADWGSVRFPPCEVISPDKPSEEKFCPYDIHRLVKLASKNLESTARPVYDSLHNLDFTRAQYRELVLIYEQHSSSNESLRSATIDWMCNNTNMLKEWSRVLPTQKDNVYIGGIFPFGNFSAGRNINSNSIIEAAELAVKAVNQNNSLLPFHNLILKKSDGNCSADAVMHTFINQIYKGFYEHMVGILGPACSDTLEPLAGVTKYYRTVVISYSAEGASLNDRDKYPYFFRTISENHQYRLVYLELLKLFKWNRIATLSEDGQKYTEYISHTQDLLQKHDIHFIANPRFPRGRVSVDYGAYLRELRDARARIIIADIQEDAAVALMCEAYKQNMTAYHGYVWFLPSWLSQDWWAANTTYCKTEELVLAIDGYLALGPRQYAASNEVMQENVTVGEWLHKYEKQSPSISPYGGYAYDAVWVYAFALDALLNENLAHYDHLHSVDTTNRLVNLINSSDFQGVSGRIKFNLGSSRSSEVLIFQWLKSDNYSKREVGYFKPGQDADSGALFMNNVTKFIWLTTGGKIPDDGTLGEPECVLQVLAEGLSLSCEAAIVVVNVIGFGCLGFILVILFFVAKKRYERKQQIIMRDLVGMEMVTAKNLDRWEFPRDRVVINRKLGEGAFGSVYGGEAQLSDKNWTAVAVKTLKPGSTTEIKLDFLSEAEVMKRFDHTNVVKLLGVCTKNEPVYTIMEFMLYGDLKTFLLARRHLVTTPSDESEEVSAKRLTSMVNDVARALSYLAELKYVHRDVACRNCLVNASRLVKLADFGMTRPIYESDYYKFSRKGMLPVRWMAPESLALGIFTPSSDVWSYGVLLYEVMTFGSFPFQGMSNSQVLELVKNGGTLVVPSGAKPQLEALIKSCWNPEYKKRPQAREIVEFLANNPRLLAPCLDAPIASVQFEEPQGDIPLPESFRKVSISLRRRLNSSATEPLLPLYGSPQPSTAAVEDEEDFVYCNP